MISNHIRSFFIILFVLGFFAFLFGPLILMSITAFNSSAFPRVSPWECFSVEWFRVLSEDQRLLEGLRNSFVIGIGVVCLSVPLGLAGALMLTQVKERIRPWYSLKDSIARIHDQGGLAIIAHPLPPYPLCASERSALS